MTEENLEKEGSGPYKITPEMARFMTDVCNEGIQTGITEAEKKFKATLETFKAIISSLEKDNRNLKDALGCAARQFEFYRDQHLEKGTEEGNKKARTNEKMAKFCRDPSPTNWLRMAED